MKKKSYLLVLGALLVAGFLTTRASAATIGLFEYAFNIDGTIADPTLGDPVPAQVNIAAFDEGTGLGTITASISGPGAHYFGAFFDHEIDEAINTFFNEYGAASGTPAVGQTWEIDEPGYLFGDIYDNFTAGSLDNNNGVPISSPDDVSMAMAWDFSLVADEIATITLSISDLMPTSGFFLSQIDPDSLSSIYFNGSLEISGAPIPEPTTLLLFGTGLAGLSGIARRRRKA